MLLLGEQIAAGMDYLASQRVVHGDLATRNVLVGAEARVKISDLGLGRHTYPHEYYAPAGVKAPLPVRWLPPESIYTGIITSESDVWSLAVAMWEVCARLQLNNRTHTHTHTSSVSRLNIIFRFSRWSVKLPRKPVTSSEYFFQPTALMSLQANVILTL